MIHYSCDRCKRLIQSHESVRYVVKMEIEAALDAFGSDGEDGDLDCLSEMDETLEQIEDDLLCDGSLAMYQRKQFDLCTDCYRDFIKNPIGREKLVPFGFSKN